MSNQILEQLLSQSILSSAKSNSNMKDFVDDSISTEFLLKEYDRMVDFRKIADDNYGKAFNLYLAIASASIAIVVPIIQTISSNQQVIVNFILIGLIVFGMATFINLSFLNVLGIQFERAILLIQDNFVQYNPQIVKFLLFRSQEVGIQGNGIKSLLLRGITSGSPKSIVSFVNSILISVFAVKIAIESTVIPTNSFLQFVLGGAIFGMVAVFHLAYTRVIYQTHGV